MGSVTEQMKIVGCLAPVDSAAGALAGAGVSLKNYNRVTFLLYVGNIQNNQTCVVEECTDSAGTSNVAIATDGYRVASTGAAAKSVLNGALTAFTAAGITLLAASHDNKIFAIEVSIKNLSAPATKPYVRVSNGAGAVALNCIIAILSEPRYQACPGSMPDPTA